MFASAGLDQAGKRGCRGRCDLLIQDAAGQPARCADYTEADGHCCLAARSQQNRAGPLSGQSCTRLLWSVDDLLSAAPFIAQSLASLCMPCVTCFMSLSWWHASFTRQLPGDNTTKMRRAELKNLREG